MRSWPGVLKVWFNIKLSTVTKSNININNDWIQKHIWKNKSKTFVLLHTVHRDKLVYKKHRPYHISVYRRDYIKKVLVDIEFYGIHRILWNTE